MNDGATATSDRSLGTLARGAFVNLFGSFYNLASRLALSLLLARLLDPAQLGVYFLAVNAGTVLAVVGLGGGGQLLLRFLARHLADGNLSAFRGTLRFGLMLVAAASVALGGLLALAAPWLAAGLLGKPELTVPLQIAALAVPLTAIEVAVLEATQAFKEMKYRVWVESVLNPTLKIALTALLIWLGFELYGALSAHVIAIAACLVGAFVGLRRVLPPGLSAHPPESRPRELFGYAAPLWGVNVLAILIPQTDLFLLAHFRPLEEVGIYSLCARLVGVMVGIGSLSAVGQIFAPFASELHYLGQYQRLGLFSKVATLWALQLFLPILVISVVGASTILGVFGEPYRAGAPVLLLLVVGQLLFVLGGPAGELLSMGGWTRLLLINNSIVWALQIVLCIVLIPRWGMLGAAAANVAALAGAKLIQAVQVYRRQGIHPLSAWMLKPLCAGVIALLLVRILFEPARAGFFQLALQMGLVLVAYAAALLLLGLDEPSRLAWQQFRSFWQRGATAQAPLTGSGGAP